MRIKVLVEDGTRSPDIGCEHGLSLYIEANGRNILFDMGQSALFLENARKMNADIGAVDAAILSHGHYDHGGGMAAFLAANSRADVYVNARAFEPHLSLRAGGQTEDVGLAATLADDPRVRKVGALCVLDGGLTIFSGVGTREARPTANRTLLDKNGAPDDFSHEQNLIVEENGADVLFTGCAHSGIANIIEAAVALRGRVPRAVVGGFHLMLREDGQGDAQYAARVAEALGRYDCKYYTGHCTGAGGVRLLANALGSRLHGLSAGLTFEI